MRNASIVILLACTLLLVAACADPAMQYVKDGNTLYARGKWDEAIAQYDQAIALNPKYSTTYIWRANAYHMKGEFDRAIADLTKAIELDPASATAYYNRGNEYLNEYMMGKGDIDKAIADYDQAVKLYPQYAFAFCNRAYAHFLKKEYGSALEDCNKAIALDSKYADPYAIRAEIYLAVGKKVDGAYDLLKFLELTTDQKRAEAVRDKLKELQGEQGK